MWVCGWLACFLRPDITVMVTGRKTPNYLLGFLFVRLLPWLVSLGLWVRHDQLRVNIRFRYAVISIYFLIFCCCCSCCLFVCFLLTASHVVVQLLTVVHDSSKTPIPSLNPPPPPRPPKKAKKLSPRITRQPTAGS